MSIDWKQLKTPAGSAEHVPGAIDNLFSPDEELREDSYWSLDNYIVVQGRLYDSAYYAVDGIVEKLNDPKTLHHYYGIEIIIEILLGRSLDSDYIIDESGQQKSLEVACRDKIFKYRNSFSELQVKSQRSRESLDLLIDLIDNRDFGLEENETPEFE